MVEAVAVVHEGRANPRQLWITKENMHTFQALSGKIMDDAQKGLRTHPACYNAAYPFGQVFGAR